MADAASESIISAVARGERRKRVCEAASEVDEELLLEDGECGLVRGEVRGGEGMRAMVCSEEELKSQSQVCNG
jgi:hypothetical protein